MKGKESVQSYLTHTIRILSLKQKKGEISLGPQRAVGQMPRLCCRARPTRSISAGARSPAAREPPKVVCVRLRTNCTEWGSAVSNGLRRVSSPTVPKRRSRDRPSIFQNRLENEAERKWKEKGGETRRQLFVNCRGATGSREHGGEPTNYEGNKPREIS